MSSTDTEAAEPSTELAVRDELAEMRAELEALKATPPAPVRNLPVSRNPVDDWVLVVRDYNLLAQSLSKTAFVPKDFQGKPDQCTAAMMYGREVGLGPMTTLQNTVVIHGKVSMYAEQLRAMVLAAGHEFDIEELNSDRCVISGRRKGSDRWQQFSYSMDQAKTAGLYSQNEQYRKRPVEMMLARASAMMCHAMFSDVIRGMGAVEEYEGQQDDQPDNAPASPAAKATAQVARKKATPKPAAVTAGPPAEPAEVVIPDEAAPLLPGESVVSEPAGSVEPTPGEGRPEQDSTPTEPAPQRNCPHISNGQQCRYYAGHEGSHTFGGGLGDPVSNKHCGHAEGHESHAWSPKAGEVYNCGGAALDLPHDEQGPDTGTIPSERHCPDFDNPHTAHVWRTDDEGAWVNYECTGVKAAETSQPAPDLPRLMTKADTIMLQARFKNMGFTDEPEDREARLTIVSTIINRPADQQVETFRAVHPGEGGMTKDEATTVLKALAPCKNRADVVDLLAKLRQERAQ